MTTAIDVVCPQCNMADFVYFRCTTCKYFAIHQPETPDMVPRRLYGVMSLDALYPRQGSRQGAVHTTATHTCTAPHPQATSPQPTTTGTWSGWLHDVTSDGDVEPNPGPTPLGPPAKRTRYNHDAPLLYQTPRMLRKRITDNPPPEQKGRRTDNATTACQEHRPATPMCHHHKRKAEGVPSHQPPAKRHMSTTQWDGQHSSGAGGNIRPKRTHEDISEHATTDTPHKKIRRTQRPRIRPYPRPTNWVHDPTQDGDTEPNPGPTAPTQVDQATQTTPPGDMGIEAHDPPLPPLRVTPLS